MKRSLAVLFLLAGCAAPPPPAASGPNIVTVNGRKMVQIPAGEFEMAGQLFYLPAFLIDYEPGPPAPGLVEADDAHVVRAEDKRYGLPERPGVRYMVPSP